MFPMRYELGFYIPEDGILHSDGRENLKSYIAIVIAVKISNLIFIRYEVLTAVVMNVL
jgi:hypothetical protein